MAPPIRAGPLTGLRQPSWSPDGPTALIVFQRDGIVVADAAGTTETVIAADLRSAEHPDWSPDGASLAFDTDASTIWTVVSLSGSGDDPQPVVECTATCVSLYEPAWSPDGTEIAYAMAETTDGTNTSRSTIQVLDVVSGSSRAVYENTSGSVWLFTPRWAPDGARIVFSEATFASTRLDEGEVIDERIATVTVGDGPASATYLTEEGRTTTTPDWSPAGDEIVFVEGDNLVTMRPDGTAEALLTSYDGVHEHALQPSYLPDGNGVVFTYVTGTIGVDDQPQAALATFGMAAVEMLGVAAPATHVRVNPMM